MPLLISPEGRDWKKNNANKYKPGVESFGFLFIMSF